MMDQRELGLEEKRRAVERVLHSRAFASSDSLARILKFLAEKSFAGSSGDLKEYSIATEALGRSSDFDPKADNIVRVQMQRLRRKLEEYYSDEGAQDTLRIVVPIGHYHPEFYATPSNGHPVPESLASPTLRLQRPVTAVKKSLPMLPWVLVGVLLIVIFASIARWPSRPASSALASRASVEVPASMSSLWKPFLPPNGAPLIVYSNALFLRNDLGDLFRYFPNPLNSIPAGAKVPDRVTMDRPYPIPAGLGPLYYSDLYTGTGEVIGAARIAQFLTKQNQDFSIKRSQFVSYDEVRNANVIFIGASFEDSVLRDLPVESDLVFEELPPRSFAAKQIRDRHPAAGQPKSYPSVWDANTGSLEEDYALLSLLPGTAPSRYVMVLGGLSTVGTQAAAEFASSPDTMALLEKMPVSAGSPGPRPAYFQALLKVAIRSGAAAKIDCLFVRDLHQK